VTAQLQRPQTRNGKATTEIKLTRDDLRYRQIRWIGYVGHQQGKIQVGDKAIVLAGVQDNMVYRESEKALIARLSTEQSTQLEHQIRMAKARGPTKRTTQVD
jgi:hypothetical protein